MVGAAMKCKKGWRFIVVDNNIEIRRPDGSFDCFVACKKCLPELKKAIKELEEVRR